MTARRPGVGAARAASASVVLLSAAAFLPSVAACGGNKSPANVPGVDVPNAKKNGAAKSAPLKGYIVTSLGEREIGPFMAKRPDGPALVGWLSAAEGTGRRVVAVPLAPNGEPRGPEKTLANTGVDATTLVVRPTRGTAPGFVLAWTVLTDRGEALWAVTVGDDGAARGKPVELARTSEDIVWIDVVPTDVGAVCVWAEEKHGGEANIVAAALDTDGKVRGAPALVARGVSGWHALELPGGVGVSTVVTGGGAASTGDKGRKAAVANAASGRGGGLSFLRLDNEGHPSGAPVEIADRSTVSGDVEVVRSGGRLVFAWTDRTTDEPFVVAAALDEQGKITPPRKVVEARGGAALLGIASSTTGTALMWESPTRRISDTRRVHVARIGASLALDGRPLTIENIGRTAPELASAGAGFAVLATMRDCDRDSPNCLDAPVLPALLRTDERASVIQREPFAFGSDPASMAWGLSCDKDNTCYSLAASGAAPARVRAAEIRARTNVTADPRAEAAAVASSKAAAAAEPNEDDPRVVDLNAVVTGESVIDLAAAHIGEGTVLATLSAKVEPPTGKRRAVEDDGSRASTFVLSTRTVDVNGASSSPIVLSTRALAVGGVAVAPAEKPEDGGVVAWVARENGDPEVHVTRIDKRGKRTNDVQLTTTKGDASDVAIVWAGGGWIVAWVDARDGNGEVYATKVGLDLNRIAREERITSAPGDASDLVALARGENVWLAWADPRESPRDGMADIFATTIRSRDAKRSLDEQRLLGTAAHSRTPQLSPFGEGVHVAWIEEAPMGVETPSSSGYGAMFASLDATGKFTKRPVKLPFGGEGAATAVSLDASGNAPRAVVARGSADAIALDAVDLSTASLRAVPLLTLDGPPSLDVALVNEGGFLYFNDDGPEPADKRARRAKISWGR